MQFFDVNLKSEQDKRKKFRIGGTFSVFYKKITENGKKRIDNGEYLYYYII